MIECVIHTVKTDMVIHTEKTEMMRLVIEIEYVGKIANVFDKVTWSFDGLQPEQMSENHSKDRLVKKVLMMELMMHTEKNDTVFHMEQTGMVILVVEIKVGGMTVDVVDKLACSSDDVQP
nr:hypothetical protein [Tanacetum cinerariifolium]